ncbi:unnamed protein product [Arctia plantaginis]|uniref:Secreted protein n=1 Tax=Arctia plantaginis TaxID=874455 RepID=A0A8S1A9L9_ARCPL|nr:unnamed protein product [Arctia plantaginis]CAB3256323.1 unnamed protein product [Arctia plantaginis]
MLENEFPWLLTAATVQFLFNVYGCEAGDPFCGDIDGVPLGQRGVLPGSTQINKRAFRATEGEERATARPMVPGARAETTHPAQFLTFTHPQLP